jgi:ABC-type amino acid transport substrate-binding protein
MRRLLLLLVMLAGGVASAIAQTATTATPLPTVTGPIPVTAASYPLMASDKLQNVVDLPKAGYVEEEFFVSGRANVYDWAADGSPAVRTPAVPYTTRIMLRRPADPRRFSGNVIVEIGNVGRRFDFSFTWGVSHDYFMENGDAWVAITYAPDNIAGLKAFNPTRYASLSMANPTAGDRCAPGGELVDPALVGMEEGLRWDMISQAGALLRAAPAGGPLAGFNVQRVYATSHGGELATYISVFHPRARLANGRPLYDGYIQHRHPGLTRLRQCGAAPAAADPRQILRNADVPVIRVVSQTDVLGTYARRRDDSDAPGDRYRLYEIAGAPHADASFYPYIPTVADEKKAGGAPDLASWPFPAQCQPEISLLRVPIMTYALDAAWANLTRWVRDGVPAPRAARVAVENGGTPQARVVTDQFGNAVGGVRTPYVEVPTATYYTSTKGPGLCGNLAHSEPFPWAKLEAVYGSSRNYAAKVADSVDRLAKDRWLVESDGRRMKAEAMTGQTSSTAVSELAPNGTLRVGINFGNALLANKDPKSGAEGGIAVDLAKELSRRLGVPMTIVPYTSAGAMADGAKNLAWDVAFLATDPDRAGEIAFAPAYVEIDSTYLVPAGSPLKTIADVDRPGVRIAVSEKSAYDLYLSRALKQATLVRTPGVDASAAMFFNDKLDALASLKPVLVELAEKHPGSRVLDGRFTSVQQAVGTPRGRDAAAAYLRSFVEDVKASGFVAKAIQANGIRGVTVAPRAQ